MTLPWEEPRKPAVRAARAQAEEAIDYTLKERLRQQSMKYFPQSVIDTEVLRLRSEGKSELAMKMARTTSRETFIERETNRIRRRRETKQAIAREHRAAAKKEKKEKAEKWREAMDERVRQGLSSDMF